MRREALAVQFYGIYADMYEQLRAAVESKSDRVMSVENRADCSVSGSDNFALGRLYRRALTEYALRKRSVGNALKSELFRSAGKALRCRELRVRSFSQPDFQFRQELPP